MLHFLELYAYNPLAEEETSPLRENPIPTPTPAAGATLPSTDTTLLATGTTPSTSTPAAAPADTMPPTPPTPTPSGDTTAADSAEAMPPTTTPQPEDAGTREPPSPRPHSPESKNAESAPSTANTNRPARIPPSAGTPFFDSALPFIEPTAIQHLQDIPAGPRWMEVLTSYLRFEPTTNAVRAFHCTGLFFY